MTLKWNGDKLGKRSRRAQKAELSAIASEFAERYFAILRSDLISALNL